MIRVAVELRVTFSATATREICLHPNNWFDIRATARLIKFDCAEHDAMVGERNRGLRQFCHVLDDAFYRRQSIEQRVFRMNVQVNEIAHGFVTLRDSCARRFCPRFERGALNGA